LLPMSDFPWREIAAERLLTKFRNRALA
jgi:hypothetical protein